jgi:hypothetical protein
MLKSLACEAIPAKVDVRRASRSRSPPPCLPRNPTDHIIWIEDLRMSLPTMWRWLLRAIHGARGYVNGRVDKHTLAQT